MKKIMTLTFGAILFTSQVFANPPKMNVETVDGKPTLSVSLTGANICLESAGVSDKEIYDLCVAHKQAEPEGLPSADGLVSWAKKRMIRRQNLSPYHLYKVSSTTALGTLGFVDFGQMPANGFSQAEFPEIVTKWQSLGVALEELDGAGKTQAVPNRGLATILPIFPKGSTAPVMSEVEKVEALSLSFDLLRQVAPYFSVGASANPTPKDLPDDWEKRLALITKKMSGSTLGAEETGLFVASSDPMFQDEPARYPASVMGLFQPSDPILTSFMQTRDVTIDSSRGFDKFYNKSGVMVYASLVPGSEDCFLR